MAHESIPFGNSGESSSFHVGRWMRALQGARPVVAQRVEPDLDLIHSPTTDPQLTWLGHGCFLIQCAGRNVLVDPVFSNRIGWLQRRHVAPALTPASLPKVDAILLTGKHRGALDRRSLTQLPRSAAVFIPHGVSLSVLRLEFNRVLELKRWESVTMGGVSIMRTPATGGRSRRGRVAGGFVVDAGGSSLYFSGPAAANDVAKVTVQCPNITAAVIHQINAPQWQAGMVEFSSPSMQVPIAGALQIIPSGWGTYLRRRPPDPHTPETLRALPASGGVNWTIPQIGETIAVARRTE